MSTFKKEYVLARPRRSAACDTKKSTVKLNMPNNGKAGSNMVGLFLAVRREENSLERITRVISFDSKTCLHLLFFEDGCREYVNLNDESVRWAFKKFETKMDVKPTLVDTFTRGSDLIGRNIEVSWPEDSEFYTARVADYRPKTRKHLICYIKDEKVETENINLRTTKRQWQMLPVKQEDDYIIGKRVIFDPDENDTTEDTYGKTACVLQALPNEELRCNAACCKWKFSSVNVNNHTIIFVADEFLTSVRMADCNFILENSLRQGPRRVLVSSSTPRTRNTFIVSKLIQPKFQ